MSFGELGNSEIVCSGNCFSVNCTSGNCSSGNYLPEKCPSGNYLTNQEVCQRRTCQAISVIYRYIFVSEWGFASTPSSKGKSHWVIIWLVSTQLCTVPSVVLYTLIPPWHFWYLFIVFSIVLSDVTIWLRNYPSWKKIRQQSWIIHRFWVYYVHQTKNN